MEVAHFSKTLVNFYQIKWGHIPEDSSVNCGMSSLYLYCMPLIVQVVSTMLQSCGTREGLCTETHRDSCSK